ncbi:UDP-glucose dehydrogenase family protein [Actinorhabdospora filicis]|uniref:UDP-glucose dehydrogenase family protein n=1 Tax=Actinorhabdospora filicis TaxID=1785913 RepID=UPI002552F3AE|nr:UDP-glucose/GDP-mannose dehydrogenase family protein [Actinorhabdospora filicis]
MAFLGCGYLGTTYAVCFAELGYDVVGMDVNAEKVAKLAAGDLPIHEPGLEALLRRNLDSGRLRFTTSYEDIAEFADVHFICVGTPQRPDSDAADLSQVETCVTDLAPHLRRKALILGKSTVPVGTAEWVETLVQRHAPPEAGVEVAWSPEFLQEGFAVEDVLRPNRVVFGVKSDWARDMLYAVHKGVFELAAVEDREVPVVVGDFATAELVKVAANAFLATKISFINAMADLCEATGGDVTLLARAIGYDDRIGPKFLRAGVGFGGGCLPKDIRAFVARAEELGVGDSLRFLHEVDRVNARRRTKVVQMVAEMCGRTSGPNGPDLSGLRVAILGVTFKANSDDVRDSPALSVARKLMRAGAVVTAYDPEGMIPAKNVVPDAAYAKSVNEALAGADLVCVLTAWEEFRHADPAALAELVSHRRIIDGTNSVDPTLWTGAGWTYRGMGRPSI